MSWQCSTRGRDGNGAAGALAARAATAATAAAAAGGRHARSSATELSTRGGGPVAAGRAAGASWAGGLPSGRRLVQRPSAKVGSW